MGLIDRLRGGAVAHAPEPGPAVTLNELLDHYEIVDVNADEGYVVVKEFSHRPDVEEPDASTAISKGQISGSSDTRYRRAVLTDYNPDLSGRLGIDKYREMRNDAVTRTTLRLAKTPVLSARWFMEPASQDEQDVQIARLVWSNLTELMSTSWPQFLTESLLMLDYGVIAFEKVFDTRKIDGEWRVVWKKFVPIMPYDITEFDYEKNHIIAQGEQADVEIPFWKALIFTYDSEGGDLWGQSVLRSAYKHWFYKENLYKIDAIQKERHGIGIPVVVLPGNFTTDDRAVADRMGQNLRTNERAHITLPPGWDVRFLKLEGQKVDALESAQHHADKLYENIMANFMLRTGDNDTQQTMFMRAARFTAEIVRGVINKWAIPQLVDFNFQVERYPELRVRRLGDETDWRTLSFALRNLIGAHAVKPDDPLEDYLRYELDLPRRDPASARAIPTRTGGTPQAPQVGTPRQSPAGGMQQGRRTEDIGRAGVDQSGGR